MAGKTLDDLGSEALKGAQPALGPVADKAGDVADGIANSGPDLSQANILQKADEVEDNILGARSATGLGLAEGMKLLGGSKIAIGLAGVVGLAAGKTDFMQSPWMKHIMSILDITAGADFALGMMNKVGVPMTGQLQHMLPTLLIGGAVLLAGYALFKPEADKGLAHLGNMLHDYKAAPGLAPVTG